MTNDQLKQTAAAILAFVNGEPWEMATYPEGIYTDAALKESGECLSECDSLKAQLAAVTKERDEAKREIDRGASLYRECVYDIEEAQDAISQVYYLVLGRSAEWSNNFGIGHAIQDIDDAQSALRQTIKTLEVERDQWKTDFDETAQDLEAIQSALGEKDILEPKPLERIRDLIAKIGELGDKVAENDHKFKSNVAVMLRGNLFSHGTITGKLEALNVHGNPTFWIYPTHGPRRIYCTIRKSLKEKMLGCIDKLVRVSGKKAFRPFAHFPHRIDVTDFEEISEPDTPIDLQSMKGSMESGESSLDQIERIRDEWE